MTRKRLIITSVISVVLVSVLMMGTTYSIFTSRDIEEDKNVYTTGNLDVTYTLSSDNVTMSNNKPTSNSDSLYIKPYRITVTNNNGNVPYMFNVVLNDTTASNVVNYQYIMLQVGKLDITSLADCTDNVIKENIIVPANDSVDIDVRVWLSDTVQNSEIEKSFYAKLSIDGIAIYDNFDEIDNSVLIAEYSEYNVPNLDTGLVPVYYDNTNEVWKKADSTNPNHSWYDYSNKMWANSILKDSDTVVDLSNNIRNAVVKGATWDKTSKTVSTDGSSTYVNVGLASYDFKQSITLVARVKFLELPSSGSNKEFLGNWEGAGGGLGIYSSKFNFSLYTGSSYKYFYSTMAPVVDTWYTVVVTYNGSKLAQYVNGESLTLDTSQSNSTDSATGNIAVSSVPFTLGGNREFLMANMVDSSNAFFPASSGTSWNGSSTLDSKYYNSYSYSSSNITDNQAVMNRARLGDATAENSGPYSGGTSAWQPGIAITGILSYYTRDPWSWVRRGGNYSEAQSGIFASGNSGGETDANSARFSLS